MVNISWSGSHEGTPVEPAARRGSPPPAGFTLVELLVTLGIIIAILSTVLAAFTFASRRAQQANTEFLMGSIKNAMARFKTDHGYYPPLLGVPSQLTGAGMGPILGWPANPPTTNANNVGNSRDLLIPPLNAPIPGNTTKATQWSANEAKALQRFNSATSLPEYLLGYGGRDADGYGSVAPGSSTMPGGRETPTLGIRSPGRDGVWGAATTPLTPAELVAAGIVGNYAGSTFNANPNIPSGLYAQRNVGIPSHVLQANPPGNDVGNNNDQCIPRAQLNLVGKSFGPYLDVKDESNIGGITGWNQVTDANGNIWFEPTVVRASEVNNFDSLPKCFIDYWGKPIRYYRRGYTQLDPAMNDTARDGTQFDLGDFFALRPFSMKTNSESDGLIDFNNDSSTSKSLQMAEFALLSYGPDRQWNPFSRVDAQGYNEDNIVETGP